MSAMPWFLQTSAFETFERKAGYPAIAGNMPYLPGVWRGKEKSHERLCSVCNGRRGNGGVATAILLLIYYGSSYVCSQYVVLQHESGSLALTLIVPPLWRTQRCAFKLDRD